LELPKRVDTVRAKNQPKCGGPGLADTSLGLLDPSSANNGISKRMSQVMIGGPFEEETKIAIRNDSEM
jgi:hypothetical protein